MICAASSASDGADTPQSTPAKRVPQKTGAAQSDRPQRPSLLERQVADFVLANHEGNRVSLSDFDDSPVVVLFFTGTDCPISNLYLVELEKLQREYADRGLQVIGLNSNAGTTPSKLAKHRREYKLSIPVLGDPAQQVADRLGAQRTAEVFLLDRQRVVRYHGRVDDRFGYTFKNATPRRRDLRLALDQLLRGERITVSETEPLGCLMTRANKPPRTTQVTYAKDVSRILQRRCHECHRPGMVGPFSLLTYEDAVQHSAMTKEVVLQGRMPPWHADPRYGHWSNNRNMNQQEMDTLIGWIDAGVPFGDKKHLPPQKSYTDGWTIEKPDVVFELPREVTIPADGVVPYLYFDVPTHFKQDVWIQAAEARPDNRAVVHHIIVSYKLPGEKNWRRRGHICGTAPGDPPTILPPGIAKKIPAGAILKFQMHYTPTGKVEKDRSQVGFVFYKGDRPPTALARTRGIMNGRFRIPAGAAHHRVTASYTFREDVVLLNLMPHMHLRGKDFLYRAKYPDGRKEILLSVPRYDFNWQNTYRFASPLRLPQGTRIDCLAHFDNSADNPANPDATQEVRWGDQTWEEMMIGWVGFVPDKPTTKPGSGPPPSAPR
ncbi:MAG: redoxin domain-containing protein [Planctomycetaceae bacterium]